MLPLRATLLCIGIMWFMDPVTGLCNPHRSQNRRLCDRIRHLRRMLLLETTGQVYASNSAGVVHPQGGSSPGARGINPSAAVTCLFPVWRQRVLCSPSLCRTSKIGSKRFRHLYISELLRARHASRPPFRAGPEISFGFDRKND